MADEKRLFDKPMDELREAFVRTRFAQEDVFGKPDIEAWLTGQREAERPEEKTWTRFLSRGTVQPWADRDFFDLRSHATALGVLNEQFGSVGEANAYGPIYDRLAFVPRGLDPKRGLYSGDAGMLYVEDHIHGPMFVVRDEWDKSGGVTITRIRSRNENPGARTILGVVLAEWQCGRPKWREARASLCRAFEDEISRERAKAEADFDSAVAVSADGTKIVHADWVVVYDPSTRPPSSAYDGWGSRRCLIFHGETFRERKIRRESEYGRVDPYVPSDSGRLGNDFPRVPIESQIARVLRWAEYPSLLDEMDRKRRQLFVRLSYIHGVSPHEDERPQVDLRTNIFVTDPRSCPSPLPDGGVEVTV